ncbi:hypothetical protein Prudu_003742 [Prunus dulcis]|uniref:Reverse transcriptase Ty1/copia-type domain-containing protein n=1 Tax=Prunus dulcis TaxID=3755 RepID=A0A4Y1QTU5_PRUDU|nr:hypothetical protein Prudu_003742 [Prunus dulcis]
MYVLRSDNGAEYVNKEHEILHETTCPYTPQQNGVDEGKNHQNFEITHASLRGITSNFPVSSHDSEASELSKGLVLDGAMRDLTASNEPTCTVPASTAPATEPTYTFTLTADNICAAPLSTTFPVPGPKSPHANILEMYYTIKHKPDGSIDKYKARLVVRVISASLVQEIAPCHEKYGYEQSNARHTLFLKRKNGKLTALIIYADDMIVTSDDLDEIGKLKGYFASEFDMKDLGGNLVTWKSKKLKVVYLLSPDIEYRAMVKGVCEVLWLKRLMGELGFPTEDTMKLYCDNQSAIKIAENSVQHDRMKHELEEKIIEVPYVKTTEQLANMLTKAVSNQAFTDSLAKLGICDIYAPS